MTAIIPTSPPVIIDRSALSATWEDYLHRLEHPLSEIEELERVFSSCGVMWVEDMGNEGINHARYNKLFTMILYSWFTKRGDVEFDLLGGCVLAKAPLQGAAPDESVYIGSNSPQYEPGEARRVNLNEWRVPDLAVEIADTTLANDLTRASQNPNFLTHQLLNRSHNPRRIEALMGELLPQTATTFDVRTEMIIIGLITALQ
jgi:Uma2 family endonuclease